MVSINALLVVLVLIGFYARRRQKVLK
jgi:hypothetical protein